MHVHIHTGDGEAKIWLEPEIELAKNYHLTRSQLREIENIIEAHYDEFRNNRNAHFKNWDYPYLQSWCMAAGQWQGIVSDKELFMPYADFPWFKDAPVGKVLNVTEPTPGHFFCLYLDVDLGIESIEHPERFSLVAKS